MVKGLYTAYSGMINEQHRMDTLTNNLANAATTGFKKEGATSQSFTEVLTYRIKDNADGIAGGVHIGSNRPGVKIGENYTNYSQGSFRETGNELDIGLSGEGFFEIEYTDKADQTYTMYTRDGSFTLTNEGYLVTKDGDFVMGEDANKNSVRIKLDPKLPVEISQSGLIAQDGKAVAQLKTVDFEDYNYLEHFGENYYHPVEGAKMKAATAKTFSGYLESSNVQVVSEMVELISVTRQYESNQKLIQAFDETLETAVTQIGRI